MADITNNNPSSTFEQTLASANQAKPTSSEEGVPGVSGAADTEGEAVKDTIDDAVPKGPKKADQYSGGRVQVGETGDLHDLAAKRQSNAGQIS